MPATGLAALVAAQAKRSRKRRLAFLAAGLAAGAVIAALLPRSKAEDHLLRPVTDRARETARSAVQAARDAGRAVSMSLG